MEHELQFEPIVLVQRDHGSSLKIRNAKDEIFHNDFL